jgi:hypothetical protein
LSSVSEFSWITLITSCMEVPLDEGSRVSVLTTVLTLTLNLELSSSTSRTRVPELANLVSFRNYLRLMKQGLRWNLLVSCLIILVKTSLIRLLVAHVGFPFNLSSEISWVQALCALCCPCVVGVRLISYQWMIFAEGINPGAKHFICDSLIAIKIRDKFQPVSFVGILAFPMPVAEFPTAVAENWYSRIRHFDSLATDREGVRDMLVEYNICRIIREANTICIQRVSRNKGMEIRAKKPLFRVI